METIFELINRKFSIQLNKYEKAFIQNEIKLLDKNVYRGHSKKEIIEVFSDVFGKKIKEQRKYTNTQLDMHEFLNQQLQSDQAVDATVMESGNGLLMPDDTTDISVVNLLGLKDSYQIQKMLNPSATYLKNYIVLDSKYRILQDSIDGKIREFKFAYTNQPNIREGFVNSIGNIRDIVQIKLYQPLIPWVSEYMDRPARRVSILIKEFSAQSFIQSTGVRAHWILPYDTYIYDQPGIELKIEDNADGVFKFTTPITTFETLTIQMGNPDVVIPFNNDRDTCSIAWDVGGGGRTLITCDHSHGITRGLSTAVYITGFTTANPVADAAIIQQINSVEPLWAISVPNGIQLILTSVNTSTVTFDPNNKPTIYFDAKRFILPMEITYLRSNL